MKITKAYCFFLYGLLFCWHCSKAQSPKNSSASRKMDSLFAVLKGEKEDTNKVNTLSFIIKQNSVRFDYSKLDSFIHIILPLSLKLNYAKGIAMSYHSIGLNYENKSKYSEAIAYFQKAMKIEQNIDDKQDLSTTLNGIGDCYFYISNSSDALTAYNHELKLSEQIGDKEGIAAAFANIGNVYGDLGNAPKWIENELAALKQEEAIGNKYGMGFCYSSIGNLYESQGNYAEALKNYSLSFNIGQQIRNNEILIIAYSGIGLVYQDQGNSDSALINLMQALKLAQKIGNENSVANINDNIGVLYDNKGKTDTALIYYFQSLNEFKKIGNKTYMVHQFGNIGNLFMEEMNYKIGRQYLDSSLTLGKELGIKDDLADDYNHLSSCDSATGDYKKALADYKMYVVYKDSLKNDENTKKIVSQQMQYDFDKKEQAAKDEQDKKDAIAATESKRQKVIIGFVIAIALAVGFIALIILRSLRITRKQKDIIELQKSEVENKNQVIEQKNKDILDSITYAKRLQDAILPPLSLIEKYFPESFVLYKPKDIVAGDFYWMEREGDTILLAACDCTGHGVPGALVSVVCSNALNRAFKEFKIRKTGLLLDKVRELVLETFSQRDTSGQKSEGGIKDGMDISFCAINTKTKEIEWSGAYNPLWYLKNGELKEIKADKQPIGEVDNPIAFSTHSLNLEVGDSIYLFTDGFADQFGGHKGKKFKYAQLKEKLMALYSKPMNEQKVELEKEFNSWKGELEQTDDVCVIGIRI